MSYRIGAVSVVVLASSTVDRGFETRSGQTKDYIFVASPLSTQLRRKSKDWLAQNQNNISEWGIMSTVYPRIVVSVS